MDKTKSALEALLATATRTDLRAGVRKQQGSITLPQAQKLTAHAATLEAPQHKLRLGIVHTYTSNLLDPWLALEAALQGLALDTYHAPYGVTVQEAQAGSGLVQHAPDVTLLLLQPQDLHPALAQPVSGLDEEGRQQLRGQVMERLRMVVGQLRAQPVGQIVLTLLPSLFGPGLGGYDAQSETSERGWWASLKADIGRWLRDEVHSSLFLDLDELLLQIGRASFFDRRYWYSAKYPFTAQAAQEVARRVIGVGSVLKFPRAKVIVLDADNTLWGGVIGEDGMEGIALGPDYPGSAYVDFQRRLLELQQRGFILAMCSKNNAADVDQVLREHPHQVLRDEHFAARRVNWVPKPDNLASLAEELNLGMDSFIFVDDSDYECAAVRRQWPQIEVVQTPAKAVEVPDCLEQVARLEVLSLTAEDRAKTQLYAQERRRKELSESVETNGGGLAEYLASLKMRMRLGLDPEPHLARLSQLTQKTNQFNLTTRRYSEHQMAEFMRSSEWLVADFSLADVFGDSGIVGLAMFRLTGPGEAELDNLLMSCRVIGREAESAFLQALLRRLESQGVHQVTAQYLPTAKNVLAKDFLAQQGFEPAGENRYLRSLRDRPAQPESAFPIAIEPL